MRHSKPKEALICSSRCYSALLLDGGGLLLGDVGEGGAHLPAAPGPDGRSLSEAGVGRDGLATVDPVHEVKVAHLVVVRGADVCHVVAVVDLEERKRMNAMSVSTVNIEGQVLKRP